MAQKEIRNIDLGISSSCNLANRFNHINNCLEKSKHTPQILLEENLFSNEFDLILFFNQLNEDFGVEGSDEFQLQYAKTIINTLKEKIPLNGVNINIDLSQEGYYYLIISTIIEDAVYPLMALNFYLKEIHVIKNPLILDINNKINALNIEIQELEKHLVNLEISYTNPLYLAGDNSLKMMDMIVRKKKYEGEIKQQVNETFSLINDCKYKLSNYYIDLEELELNNTKVEVLSEQYISRLKKYFNFSLIELTNTFYDEIEIITEDKEEAIEFEFEIKK